MSYFIESDTYRKGKIDDLGSSLVKFGAGGLVLGGVALVLPGITLPMLLVLAVLIGGYLKIKS